MTFRLIRFVVLTSRVAIFLFSIYPLQFGNDPMTRLGRFGFGGATSSSSSSTTGDALLLLRYCSSPVALSILIFNGSTLSSSSACSGHVRLGLLRDVGLLPLLCTFFLFRDASATLYRNILPTKDPTSVMVKQILISLTRCYVL